MNVKLNKNFSQVCVWPGTILKEEEHQDCIKFFKENLGTRIQILETIKTKPSIDSNGNNIPETGGRYDLLFAIHDKDVSKFAVPRLEYGIRWIEDVLDNEEGNYSIYPNHLTEYRSW